MRLVRLRTTGLAALPLVALAVLAPTAASAAPASTGVSAPAELVPLMATTSTAESLVDADALPDGRAAARTATFKVTYKGFTPAARASFQRAVDYWSTQVVSKVPITVNATFKPLGTGVLGSAGPSSVWRDFSGAPQKATWYVDAIANKRAGKQLGASPDIVANFSSSFNNWNFSSGAAPKGKYDFQSVVLHELGHGLGFLGAGRVSSGNGSVKLSGFPISYDRYTENGAGKSLLSFPDGSKALGGQITGGKLFFDSKAVRSANGGKAAKLYAPGNYQPGSSYSHLDEGTYRAGNANSLMTPQIGDGETVRKQGPIVKGVFSTIGW